jgi:hypothetical protein
MTVDALLSELFRLEADPPVRPEGRTAGILRDLWLGGVPLPRAAAAAGLTVKAAERTLRSLGLLPVEAARKTHDASEPVESRPEAPAPQLERLAGRRGWALRSGPVDPGRGGRAGDVASESGALSAGRQFGGWRPPTIVERDSLRNAAHEVFLNPSPRLRSGVTVSAMTTGRLDSEVMI